jgi:hypothetical protein
MVLEKLEQSFDGVTPVKPFGGYVSKYPLDDVY